jgi:hypothetical protein
MKALVLPLAGALVWAAALAGASAQQPDLRQVVTRLGEYITGYEARLATVVAEEIYRQRLSGPGQQDSRVLRSDYALTRPADRSAWVGVRDTFEVDGEAVRDRDARLEQLIASGSIGQASRIAGENARYNLAADVLRRNVNVPTFALEVLHPRNRERFSFRRRGEDSAAGRRGWLIEFRERDRPTLVRRPDGRDNPTRGSVLVDPATGEVLRTTLSWEKVRGQVTVDYGRVGGIDVPVPLRMTEQFAQAGSTLSGEATYANYRQFRASGRLITP